MSTKYLLLALVALTATPMFSQTAPQEHPSAAQPSKKQAAATQAPQQHEDEGDRIFQQNCSRCHTAPDGFSSRISGSIVRHMRVRASLSQHDAEELLRFFNP